MDRDELAQKIYGVPYSRLSAWGQSAVDSSLFSQPSPQPRLEPEREIIERLSKENYDLREEVEGLKAEIASLWSEINK